MCVCVHASPGRLCKFVCLRACTEVNACGRVRVAVSVRDCLVCTHLCVFAWLCVRHTPGNVCRYAYVNLYVVVRVGISVNVNTGLWVKIGVTARVCECLHTSACARTSVKARTVVCVRTSTNVLRDLCDCNAFCDADCT